MGIIVGGGASGNISLRILYILIPQRIAVGRVHPCPFAQIEVIHRASHLQAGDSRHRHVIERKFGHHILVVREVKPHAPHEVTSMYKRAFKIYLKTGVFQRTDVLVHRGVTQRGGQRTGIQQILGASLEEIERTGEAVVEQ